MRWIVAVVVVVFSSAFLLREYRYMNMPEAPPRAAAAAGPRQDIPLLDEKELAILRKSAENPDSGVRWSAIQLLYMLKAPESAALLEKTVAEDPDTDVRMRAVHLLNETGTSRQIPGLVKALNDLDKDVRLASLQALGNIGDPSAAPWVANLLKDPEDDVRAEALRTLGKFQDKRRADFEALTEQLRRQYEAAVRKSQQSSQ